MERAQHMGGRLAYITTAHLIFNEEENEEISKLSSAFLLFQLCILGLVTDRIRSAAIGRRSPDATKCVIGVRCTHR